MVLEFSSHNSEGIVYEMVIDMNFRQPVRGTWWYPLLVQVIVDHDGSPCRGNTLLRSFVTEIKEHNSYLEKHSLNFIVFSLYHFRLNRLSCTKDRNLFWGSNHFQCTCDGIFWNIRSFALLDNTYTNCINCTYLLLSVIWQHKHNG